MVRPRPRWLSGQSPLRALALAMRGVAGGEDRFQRVQWDSRAVVLDGEQKAGCRTLRGRLLAQADVDAAARGHGFGCVLHQVDEHARQVFAGEPHRACAALGVER